ncbi:MAG: hypothetical protein HY321_13565 [Armatimonadetes bacterium]|nr:hypothetical protein [Armatimonadota bacterium]
MAPLDETRYHPSDGSGLAAKPSRLPGLTLRAVLVGILFIVLNCYWVVHVCALGTVNRLRTEAVSPFFNAIFTLLAATAINALVRRARPRLALTNQELITAYVMASLGTALCSTDMLQAFVILMTYPFWTETPVGDWPDLFFRYIPRWLSVRDTRAVGHFYAGHSTLYTAEHLRAWAVPVLSWTALLCVLLFMMLCINAIVRRHWNERERLTYPILQLPLAITRDGSTFFRNRLMWIGFGFAALMELINGLAYLTPTIPRTPFNRHHLITPGTFTTRPWSALWYMDYDLILAIIGLGFLIPVDLLFSAWFFFLLSQGERVFAEACGLGLNDPMNEYYVFARGTGAYIGLAIMQLWLMKGYLKQVARKAFGKASDLTEGVDGEALSYRRAVLGLAGGGLFVAAFGLAAGMTLTMIAAYFAFYFTFAVVTTRIRAEVGLIGTGLYGGGTTELITTAVGSPAVGPANLTVAALFSGFNHGHRGHPMPVEMEGIRMAEATGMRRQGMSVAIMIAAVVGCLVSFWILLHTYYRVGAAETATYGYGRGFSYTFGELASQIRPPGEGARPAQWANMGAGVTVVLILATLRVRFPGWPLHPIGYAIAPALNQVWMAAVVAWALKASILRYSGRKGYHRALPFFLGLMLGDYTVGMLWTLLGVFLGIPTYNWINL